MLGLATRTAAWEDIPMGRARRESDGTIGVGKRDNAGGAKGPNGCRAWVSEGGFPLVGHSAPNDHGTTVDFAAGRLCGERRESTRQGLQAEEEALHQGEAGAGRIGFTRCATGDTGATFWRPPGTRSALTAERLAWTVCA